LWSLLLALAPRPLVSQAHDPGASLAQLAQLLTQRPTLGHEVTERVVVGGREGTRQAIDRSLERVALVEGGANGGANGAALALFGLTRKRDIIAFFSGPGVA
jgi:hypothetical protein